MTAAFATSAEAPALQEGEVQVFSARLAVGSGALRAFAKTLDAEETKRAARFRFELHRERFIAAHGILRVLAGEKLGIEPAGVRFTRTEHGKPALAGAGARLKFNMSHSEEIALFAFAWDAELGVDVECCKRDFPWREVAAGVLTPRESALLAGAAPADAADLFFRIWTCKEACLKAGGKGLSLAPKELEVTLDEGGARIEAPDGEEWRLFELEPAANCRAALEMLETPSAVRCYARAVTAS